MPSGNFFGALFDLTTGSTCRGISISSTFSVIAPACMLGVALGVDESVIVLATCFALGCFAAGAHGETTPRASNRGFLWLGSKYASTASWTARVNICAPNFVLMKSIVSTADPVAVNLIRYSFDSVLLFVVFILNAPVSIWLAHSGPLITIAQASNKIIVGGWVVSSS